VSTRVLPTTAITTGRNPPPLISLALLGPGGDSRTRDPDTISSEIEAVRATLMMRLDTCCTGILRALVVQDGHQDPPVVYVPEFSASEQWRALLARRVVSDVRIERPTVHLNLMQVRHEARDEAPVQERGWQEALQAVYPIRINELWVVDGEFTYIDTQLVGDDIVVRFVGLGGLCSTETSKGTGEDVVGVVGATDGPQMGHSVRSPRKQGTSSRHVHAVPLGVGALIGDEINVLSHQGAIGLDAVLTWYVTT
jgi:hypothetical protein